MRSSDAAWRAAALISAACLSGACALSRLWVLAAIPLALLVLGWSRGTRALVSARRFSCRPARPSRPSACISGFRCRCC